MSENMNMGVDYATFVKHLVKPGEDIAKHVMQYPHQADLLHMCLGVAGEAGEL